MKLTHGHRPSWSYSSTAVFSCTPRRGLSPARCSPAFWAEKSTGIKVERAVCMPSSILKDIHISSYYCECPRTQKLGRRPRESETKVRDENGGSPFSGARNRDQGLWGAWASKKQKTAGNRNLSHRHIQHNIQTDRQTDRHRHRHRHRHTQADRQTDTRSRFGQSLEARNDSMYDTLYF